MASSPGISVQILALLLLITSSATSAPYTPRLSIHPPDILGAGYNNLRNEKKIAASSEDEDFKVFFYNQTLDHFNYRPESYTTFPQKYVVNSKYWGGANSSAPIFAYLGAETPIDGSWSTIGFLDENSPRFKALQLYIEHRFYGDSDPSDSIKDDNISGYFSSAQALADYAEIILYVKKMLNAENSPVIVFGASYGGTLAAYFRLKYPHIAHGALASSAPVLLFNNFVPHYGFYEIVSKDFQKTSQSCYDTIKSSWAEIDRVASEPNGLITLRQMFKLCKPLSSADHLKNFLVDLFSAAAQYNLPQNLLDALCGGIDNSSSDTSVLSKTVNGYIALIGLNSTCTVNSLLSVKESSNQTLFLGWNWQSCTEFLYTFARDNNTMFQPDPAPVQLYVDECMNTYNVRPRPYWVSTNYGGRDMKSALRQFGSNIIFANGLADPFSNGGYCNRILEDLSNTLRAVYTVNGSHILDLLSSRTDDPEWLVKQRKTEVNIITKWLKKYYVNLKQC